MRVKVLFGERQVTYDVPDGVHFVGFTMDNNGNRWLEWEFSADGIEKNDVEIVNEAGLRVVVHCYTAPVLAEVAEVLADFKEMCFYKMSWGEIDLSIVL